jgi:hypothetical protein
MSDIEITIDNIKRSFNLLSQQNNKIWTRTEEPMMPTNKAAVETPSYGDLDPSKALMFAMNSFRGGVGQVNIFDILDMYGDGYCIDTREINKAYLGPGLQYPSVNANIGAVKQYFMYLNREYAVTDLIIYRLKTDKSDWDIVLDVTGSEHLYSLYA